MKKYLRSILCLLLALSVVFCFAACSDKDDEEDEEDEEEAGSSIAGTYVLDSIEEDGEKMTAEDMEDLDIYPEDFYIVLNKDGTGTICIEGDKADIEWDDEKMTAEGESLPYTVKGSKIIIEIDRMTMTFKKSDEKISTNEEIKEEEPEVTSTTYGIYAVIAEGVTVTGSTLTSAGMTPADTYLTLNDDGTAVLCITNESIDMQWSGTSVWNAEDTTDRLEMSIDGDAVTVSVDGTVMVFLKNGSSQVPDLSTSAPTTSTAPEAGAYSLKSMSDSTTTYEGTTLDLVVSSMNLNSIDELMYLELNADGTGKLMAMGVEGTINYDETKLWPQGQESEAIDYTYANGELRFSLEGYTYVFAKK